MKKSEKFVLIGLFYFFILLLFFLVFLKVKEKFLKQTSIYIFLTKQEGDQTFIVPLQRNINFYKKKLENKIEYAILELIKGPTEEEKGKGFSTSLNENTKLLNVSVEDNIVNLNFSKEVEEGGGTLAMETRIAQIVYTATQFPTIKKVRFLIEGKTIEYFSGEGITIVEKPVSRDDLKEFDIKIIEEERNEKRDSS
ncbi:MAG: GerMN domain-containing protein [Candidatus Omnitrophica bacterium]|nr:GerMN domain-containing protein [Candidatus Omnitrophota bacterium]